MTGGQVQLDPELVKEVGVVPWLLMLITLSGTATISWFLWRITRAMDRMAAAQEATPGIVAGLKALVDERTRTLESKLDRAVSLAERHVEIGETWLRTEAVGRQIKGL